MIEILATGLGVDQDLATLSAMKNAVQQQTRIFVDTTTNVFNSKIIEQTIITRSCAYITSYTIRSIEKVNNKYQVRVLCTVDEKKLINDVKLMGPTQIDGLLLAIGAQQSKDTWDDYHRKEVESTERKKFQREQWELFLNNYTFRQTFPIKVKSVKPEYGPQKYFWVQLEAKFIDMSGNPELQQEAANFTYGMILIFLDSKNRVIHKSRGSWTVGSTGESFEDVPTDITLLSKVKKVQISWE